MQGLTDFDNQVLVKITTDSRKGGRDGFWTEPPRTEIVTAALRTLSRHKMIVRKVGAWWLVRPTAKGIKHVEARKRGKAWRIGMVRHRKGA